MGHLVCKRLKKTEKSLWESAGGGNCSRELGNGVGMDEFAELILAERRELNGVGVFAFCLARKMDDCIIRAMAAPELDPM